MLTILLGDYGSGKTRTAKYLAKKNDGVHLRFEMLIKGNVPLVDKLKSIMKPGINYYIDGWNGVHYDGRLPKILNTEVSYIVCMAGESTLKARQEKKIKHTGTVLPRSITEIRSIFHLLASIALSYDNTPLFADTTTYPPSFWQKYAWEVRWKEINLYSRFEGAGEYQDVELSDRYITGLSESYKTWERLNALVDFKGKSVIDYGCNYGYFCFKAEYAGATSVIGIDVSSSIINTAHSIGITKGSMVRFIITEIKAFWPNDSDIIMALNTLHHLNYDRRVLIRIFNSAATVIFEMPAKDLPKVDELAVKYSFLKTIISSHREGRCIAIYNRNWQPKIPSRYIYHHRYESVKWWLIHKATRCYPLSLMYHLWRKLR